MARSKGHTTAKRVSHSARQGKQPAKKHKPLASQGKQPAPKHKPSASQGKQPAKKKPPSTSQGKQPAKKHKPSTSKGKRPTYSPHFYQMPQPNVVTVPVPVGPSAIVHHHDNSVHNQANVSGRQNSTFLGPVKRSKFVTNSGTPRKRQKTGPDEYISQHQMDDNVDSDDQVSDQEEEEEEEDEDVDGDQDYEDVHDPEDEDQDCESDDQEYDGENQDQRKKDDTNVYKGDHPNISEPHKSEQSALIPKKEV